MVKLILLKLGGSLITNKNKVFTAKDAVIRRLGKEIKSCLPSFKGKIVIGHGSGSFGHTVAAKYKTQEGIINPKSKIGFPLVAEAARRINTIVINNLLKEGLKVISFSPLSFISSHNGKTKKCFLDSIKRGITLGFIPVIYGDVILDEGKRGFGIYSGEKSLNLLGSDLKGKYDITIIYVGDTNGVYDEKDKTIAKITPKTFKVFKKAITGSKATDVTGGMLHKVEESLLMAKKYGIKTIIINGKRKDNLKKAILGKKIISTLISPQ